MSDIRVDRIDEVDSFRSHLTQFNKELAASFSSIRGHWASLRDGWDDDMYQSLGAALDEVMPGVDSYLAAAESHERYLGELIERFRAVRGLAGR